MSQVTIKTLHHYDELGLLKPVHTDPITNYRFYDVEQLPRIHRIMALKEMGLSLEQRGIYPYRAPTLAGPENGPGRKA